MILKFGMQHRVLEYYQIPSNDDPGLNLTNFTTRSNLVPYTFVWEKGKTMDFSGTIVVYDLKLATDDRSFNFDSECYSKHQLIHFIPSLSAYENQSQEIMIIKYEPGSGSGSG